MFEANFNPDDFDSIINEVVPSYQRGPIIELVIGDMVEMQGVDDLGMSLLGEKASASFVIPTRVGGGSTDETPKIWPFVKKETYSLFCTDSAEYAKEREDGGSTVKNLITIVATAVAAHFSLPIGIVVGAVTLCIMTALKIGLNAYCNSNRPAT
jgi:hypothetical protein